MLPEWNGTLLSLFLDSSLRVTLVAASVALILVAIRVRSSGVRHAAWTAVLCAMLLMPVLPYCVPPISLAVPAYAPGAESIPDAATTRFVLQAAEGVQSDAAYEPIPAVSAPMAAHGSLPETVPGTAPARGTVWPLTVLIIYAGGVMILLCRLVLGWRGMARIANAARLVQPGGMSPAEPCAAAPLYESSLVATPLTVGVISSRIILPLTWSAWDEDKLSAVLAHELAHVQRRDLLIALLARLNRCIFWFHPLAWWLERKLAVTAEHACDDAAVRAIGKSRRYVEVLLDMAEAVRRSGGRLAWQGVGVNGNGLLGQRIDRILRGDLLREMSRTRKAVVAVSCAAAIFVIVACHQQPQPPAPLQVDPKVAAQRAQEKADSELWKSATEMNAKQVADLEAALKKNPEDLAILKKLLLFYRPFGVPVPGEKDKWAPICAQVLGENECIAARRPHILWLIEHHPESDLTEYADIYANPIDPLPDPAGYAEAKKLWLAQADRPDASVPVLRNAASFFFTDDKPMAEKILLRAQALDPKGRWSSELGRLYAFALVGSNDQRLGNVVRSVSPAEARGSFAQAVRKKLAETTDTQMLTTAGQYLIFFNRHADAYRIDFDAVALGKSYLERAVQLNPQSGQAHMILSRLATADRNTRIHEMLRNAPKGNQYETVSALPEAERFDSLPELAIEAYMEGEYADYYRHDAAGAKAAWERARKYAQDALQLAPKFRDDPDYSTAVYMGNIVLGLATFRVDGNRQAAVNFMLAASHAPVSEDLDYYVPFHTKLTGYLLKYGERASVIEFLERIAQVSTSQKSYLLEAADQIRKGFQPLWYPRDTTSH